MDYSFDYWSSRKGIQFWVPRNEISETSFSRLQINLQPGNRLAWFELTLTCKCVIRACYRCIIWESQFARMSEQTTETVLLYIRFEAVVTASITW